MTEVTWVLEADAFPASHERLRAAVAAAGLPTVLWSDDWWATRAWPRLDGSVVVFRGSLANAHAVREKLPWRPGAFCATPRFHCSKWYPGASRWLLHRDWRLTTVADLVADPHSATGGLGGPSVFVRPDSPLKPFGGQVLRSDAITLKALDHGYYFDDLSLPIVVAPVRVVGREWRYVVVGRRVVAGSAYGTDGAVPDSPASDGWRFAESVASQLEPPEDVYVMDVCEADGALWLLELNPFSGADLYACDLAGVVAPVCEAAARGR